MHTCRGAIVVKGYLYVYCGTLTTTVQVSDFVRWFCLDIAQKTRATINFKTLNLKHNNTFGKLSNQKRVGISLSDNVRLV